MPHLTPGINSHSQKQIRINLISVECSEISLEDRSVPHSLHRNADQSLSSIYTLHHGWLVSWLQRKLGNRDDAADIAQDTFTRLCVSSRVQSIEQAKEPRAYLTVVAKGLMFNHLERRSLEQAYLTSLAFLPEEWALSTEQKAILLETLIELDALLNALPTPVRTVFLLSQLDGMSYEAIAGQMQLSVRTVSRYMAQGFRQCLHVMLEA